MTPKTYFQEVSTCQTHFRDVTTPPIMFSGGVDIAQLIFEIPELSTNAEVVMARCLACPISGIMYPSQIISRSWLLLGLIFRDAYPAQLKSHSQELSTFYTKVAAKYPRRKLMLGRRLPFKFKFGKCLLANVYFHNNFAPQDVIIGSCPPLKTHLQELSSTSK